MWEFSYGDDKINSRKCQRPTPYEQSCRFLKIDKHLEKGNKLRGAWCGIACFRFSVRIRP